MTESKVLEYKKAYVELDAIIKKLPQNIINKIPSEIIENIENSKAQDYSWSYDDSKELEDQSIMVETKALFVQLYKKYFADQSEKEKWNKYDKTTQQFIEEQKREKYDPSKIFESTTNISNNNESLNNSAIIDEASNSINNENKDLILAENETFFQKISNLFKSLISKIFNKNK